MYTDMPALQLSEMSYSTRFKSAYVLAWTAWDYTAICSLSGAVLSLSSCVFLQSGQAHALVPHADPVLDNADLRTINVT